MSGYWPSAAVPSLRVSFLSSPLMGEMSGVLWRAELIMAAQIQPRLRRAPGFLNRRLLNVAAVSGGPPSKDEMIKKPNLPD